MATDFNYESGTEITKAVADKTIKTVETPDEGMNEYLIIRFTDGSSLRFRYDYIYDWEIRGADE